MAYIKGSITSKNVVVEQPYGLTLEVSNQSPAVGEKIRFHGTIMPSPGIGAEIELYAFIPQMWIYITSAIVGAEGPSGGVFSVEWTVPHRIDNMKISGGRIIVNARFEGYQSNGVTLDIYMPSRISLNVPDRVKVNEEFMIQGKLEYEYDSGDWKALGGKKVEVYINDSLVDTVTTDDVGNYSLYMTIKEAGIYTIKVKFAGETVQGIAGVSTKEYVDVTEMPSISLLKLLAIIGLIVGGVTVGYMVVKQ